MTDLHHSASNPDCLGAVPDDHGTAFAVFSAHATQIDICLFDAQGVETRRIPLPERSGHVWHGHIAGLQAGQHYGLRAHGPFAPEKGHLFNPAKLLIDPYARQLTGRMSWHAAMQGVVRGDDGLAPCPIDSAPHMPKCVIRPPLPAAPPGPRHAMRDSVIYEAHLRGLSMQMPGVTDPGTPAALRSDQMLDHLSGLGITAVEFLPLQAFIDDRFLVEKGLVNYWGYQPVAWCAPDPRHATTRHEIRDIVHALHARGIEVIVDVVYNHTGEGDAMGPMLSLKGLDNASYYRRGADGKTIDDTGCGNTLNLDHPMVLRLVLDSLRLWVQEYGVDGFRFDLAATLGRVGNTGFDANAPFLAAIRQDPMLRGVKLIAEPWDIGPGGYQLGAFPHPFAEWNDKFRDGARQFWRGDAGAAPDLAARITGSAQQFDHSGRAATASVNFLTAHDGFTLMDVVSYAQKHNHANGEGNRDGHDNDYSANHGVEGASDDPAIIAARARTRRNLMATLLLSQGVPMLLAGDEIGNSQQGNNNAYCQDSPIGWVDWSDPDTDFLAFTRRMIAFRKARPILRQTRFLHSRAREEDEFVDLFWWHPAGRPMEPQDWEDPELRVICVEKRTAHGTPPWDAQETALFLVFNAGSALDVTLPDAPEGLVWTRALDTQSDDGAPDAAAPPTGGPTAVAAHSVVAFVLENAG